MSEAVAEEEASPEVVDVVQMEENVMEAIKSRGIKAVDELIKNTQNKQALKSVAEQLRNTPASELAAE